MIATDYPLPITHQYRMTPDAGARAAQMAAVARRPACEEPSPRPALQALPSAAMLLRLLADELEPSELIVSTFGIREGLLYSKLEPSVRRARPADRGGARGRRRPSAASASMATCSTHWIAPSVRRSAGDARGSASPPACSPTSPGRPIPDFRAERGVEMALHGNWVGVDAAGPRDDGAGAVVQFRPRPICRTSGSTQLVHAAELDRAHQWGLAMRLGQRLSGGVGAVLERTRCLSSTTDCRWNCMSAGDEALVGEAVQRRLKRSAEALGRRGRVAAAVLAFAPAARLGAVHGGLVDHRTRSHRARRAPSRCSTRSWPGRRSTADRATSPGWSAMADLLADAFAALAGRARAGRGRAGRGGRCGGGRPTKSRMAATST